MIFFAYQLPHIQFLRAPYARSRAFFSSCVDARLLLPFCVAATITTAWAGPPYNVDDPGTASAGHVQLYLPFEFNSSTGVQEFNVGLSYGLSERTELDWGTPEIKADDGANCSSGMGDTTLTAKHRFFQSGTHSAAWVYQLSIPTGNARRGLGNGYYSQTLYLTAATQIGRGTLWGNAGATTPCTASTGTTLFYGAAYELPVSSKTSLGLQLYGNSATGETPASLAWGIGARHAISPSASLLLSASQNLRNGPSFMFYGGIVFDFNVKKHFQGGT